MGLLTNVNWKPKAATVFFPKATMDFNPLLKVQYFTVLFYLSSSKAVSNTRVTVLLSVTYLLFLQSTEI